MAKKSDTVSVIMQRVRAAAPDLPDPILEKIARGIHADLGGATHYVTKSPSWGKAWRLSDAIGAGVPFAQAFKRLGMSRSTAYRARARGPWKTTG